MPKTLHFKGNSLPRPLHNSLKMSKNAAQQHALPKIVTGKAPPRHTTLRCDVTVSIVIGSTLVCVVQWWPRPDPPFTISGNKLRTKSKIIRNRSEVPAGRGEQIMWRTVISQNWILFAHSVQRHANCEKYEGWNFNSDNYLFTTDTK